MPRASRIKFDGDFSSLNRGVNQAARNVDRFASSFVSAGVKGGTAFDSIAGGLRSIPVIGTVAGAAGTRFSDLVHLERMSRILGTSVTELDTLKLAAESSGVGFEHLTTGLLHFQDQAYQLASGRGPLIEALARIDEQLGTSTLSRRLEFFRGDAIDNFREFARLVSRVENPAQRNAIATALWGSAGVTLMGYITRGVDTMTAFEKIARDNIRTTEQNAIQFRDLNDALVFFGQDAGLNAETILKGLKAAAGAAWPQVGQLKDSFGQLIGIFTGDDSVAASADEVREAFTKQVEEIIKAQNAVDGWIQSRDSWIAEGTLPVQPLPVPEPQANQFPESRPAGRPPAPGHSRAWTAAEQRRAATLRRQGYIIGVGEDGGLVILGKRQTLRGTTERDLADPAYWTEEENTARTYTGEWLPELQGIEN